MFLENNKTVLIYGFGKEEEETISNLLIENSLPNYKVIEKSMGKMKIRDLLNGLKFEIFNIKLPEEKVILLYNFDDEELNTMISSIRNNLRPVPILAVITETSIGWTFDYLLEHLIEEREWFKKHGR